MVFCWTVTLAGVSVYMVVDDYCFVFGTGCFVQQPPDERQHKRTTCQQPTGARRNDTTGQQQTPARQHEGATNQQPTSARHDDVLLVYPLWLRHGRILKKAFGMGCLRVFEHPLVPRLWLQFTSTDTVGAKQKVWKRIKIGSLNIQNIRGNTIFVQTVMKKTEILFIQEHWLFYCNDMVCSIWQWSNVWC
jgi:hypothetical protein